MTPPRFSFIFVNYQSSRELESSIISWQAAAKGIESEFIIVNNDPLEEAAVGRIASLRQAKLRQMGANFGFGKACNEGAKLAEGRLLFFLNPDTRYRGGSLASLEAVAAAHPRSIGGIRLISPDGSKEPWSAGHFPTLGRLICKWCFGAPFRPVWEARHFRLTDWVSGAALVLPKAVFEELGGFDERYFLYFEDVDLCRRAVERGMAVWRFPFLVAEHRGGASHASRASQKAFYYESQERYFAQHQPRLEAAIFKWLRILFQAMTSKL